MKIVFLCMLFSIFSMMAAPFIYITNAEDGSVTVVDVATNEIIATIPSGTSFDVVVNPMGTRAYFADSDNAVVIVIDTATNTVITAVPVGINPTGVAITHDGRTVYVTNTVSNTVTPIDTATNTAGTPIAGFNQPVDITISPDDKTAYVANSATSTVIPVDLATGTLGTPIPVTNFPRSITISPNGQTVYVTTTGGVLNVISTATNTVTATVVLGGFLDDVVVSFDNRRVYVSSPTINSLFILDAGSNSVIATIAIENPLGLVLDPCGQILYIASGTTGTLIPLLVANNTLGTPFTAGPFPFRLAITPIIDVQGKVIKNIFLNKIELVVKLNWHVLPITTAAFFRVFQNGIMVGQVFAGSPSNFVVCLSPNFVCSSSSKQSTNVEFGIFAASGVEIARIPLT